MSNQPILTDTMLLNITNPKFISDHLESRLVPNHFYSEYDNANRCYVPLPDGDFGFSLAVRVNDTMAIAINNQYLTTIGKSFDQLWNMWIHSTPVNIKCEPLNSIIASFWQSPIDETPTERLPIFVCTSQNCDRGGAAIMHPAIQKHFLEMFEEPFYILFSSIHEALIIPSSQGDPKDLQTMLREMNSCPDVISPSDIATNYIYVCPSPGHIERVVI